MFADNHINFDSINSTNSFALGLKGTSLFSEGLLVTTNHQDKGRGNYGKEWESAYKKNLLLSLVVEPSIPLSKQFDLNIMISLAIYDFLYSLDIICDIKWPNDLLIDNAKISGILIDNVLHKDIIAYSVIGIGINVNQLSFNEYFPPATSIKKCLSEEQDCKLLLNKLLQFIEKRIIDYRKGFDQQQEYNNLLYLRDKESYFIYKGNKFKGMIKSVQSGLIKIETTKSINKYNINEIKFCF